MMMDFYMAPAGILFVQNKQPERVSAAPSADLVEIGTLFYRFESRHWYMCLSATKEEIRASRNLNKQSWQGVRVADLIIPNEWKAAILIGS